MKVKLFAYGSNMSSARLHKKERAPSAQAIGRGKLIDTRLIFNKVSKDGSTKANIEKMPGNVTWGILYELDEEDLPGLDAIERGYDRIMVDVKVDSGELIKAYTYESTNIIAGCKPFKSYLEIIIRGAKEHNLPKYYINILQTIRVKQG